jgi:hypothetical protein
MGLMEIVFFIVELVLLLAWTTWISRGILTSDCHRPPAKAW